MRGNIINRTKYLLLAGGVGAAKFVKGIASVVDQEDIAIVVNTGDDIDLFGLKICPDLDIITYTLAGVVDDQKGWGFQDESFNCLNILSKYYGIGWFNAGDKDLATHIFRTDLIAKGFNKYEATQAITQKLGIKARIVPMCNEEFQTYIQTPSGTMHFEEYFIKERCEPRVIKIEFRGNKNARPIKAIFDYIKSAERIIICPSNPIVSIGTILSVLGIKEALKNAHKKVIAISPIIKGATLKGPADKLMEALGHEASCVGVAKYYQDIISHFVIDSEDYDRKIEIDNLGIQAHCFDTIMKDQKKKEDLARFVLDLEL
ncbi:MAG: 2-phospho-L-lactate transferase [Candidatus Lokiarchaeota archaeon]|nr:2-phospho-L-lactate transferase [Candidatus Lokiarchaeota archaeon]